jgi:tetratricopeptide (TPR) repeat protein
MTLRRSLTAITLAVTLSVLAACDSSEERAEKHYQSGLEYLQAGDVSRALVEFRNVFQLNGQHKEARRTYAKVELDRGNIREAYSQYLRLVEQFPDDIDGLRALAQISAQNNDWASASRYVSLALAQLPEDVELLAIKAVADYGTALDENSPGDQVRSVEAVRQLRVRLPDNLLLRRVIIGDLIRAQKNTEALQEIESALLIAPLDRGLYAQRLSLYAALGDDKAVEAGLRDMVMRFPDSPEMKSALVRWYVSRKEFDKAEAHLRDQITSNTDDVAAILELVRFLATYHGPEIAVAELEKHITPENPNPIFRSSRASFLFDLGRRDESIAEMQDILTTAQPSSETRRIKVGLARMLTIVGNVVAARELVEQVLAEDSGDTEALKLKAGWLILADQVGEAITILRDALDQNPRDPSIMTLMAQAYERDGNRDLLREMLSLAVNASNRAPEESLRYAQLLASEDKFIAAEGVLIDALRIAPGNLSLLVPLGQIYLHVKDWPRATTVVEALETIGAESTKPDIINMRAAILAGQKQTDEAIGYLEGLVDDGSGNLSTKIAIVRAHLANGDDARALAYSTKLLGEYPDDPTVRFIDATVRSLTGDTTTAEAAYRALLDEDPNRLPAWMALFRLVASIPDRIDELPDLVDRALSVLPGSGELLWAKAGILERRGDIDGAIAIYEDMYRENSANPIIANNLASLLSNHHPDSESIARAEIVARRLRGSGNPPYQDTFGWIAYLRGNYEEALAELEPAAVGLPEDANVQYHLAMTYIALDRMPEALARLRLAHQYLEPGDTSDLTQTVQNEIARLESAGVSANN